MVEAKSSLDGTVLDSSYRLVRTVGEGGMGAVYEGIQLRLNQRVAVKLMAREMAANQDAYARFRREAEITSALDHPHIVHVRDFGLAPGGEPYLVMEYLEGEDLEHRLERVGRFSLAHTLHIVKQVASALAATHLKGIVHRDLKPANIFLVNAAGETDFVKVLDFGISKVQTSSTTLTKLRMTVGTPRYMSPEQARGRTDILDHRADQWALACITWQMLSGAPPFGGQDVNAVLYQVCHESPPSLVERVPGLPPEVETVLSRALSKSHLDRFSSIGEFAHALRCAALGRAPSDITPVPEPRAAARRVRSMILVGGACVLLLGAGLSLPALLTSKPTPPPPPVAPPAVAPAVVMPVPPETAAAPVAASEPAAAPSAPSKSKPQKKTGPALSRASAKPAKPSGRARTVGKTAAPPAARPSRQLIKDL
jgi:serine/threonine-protein kinase